ncbi:MAG TPA: hypothetical protein V6C76_11645 [Drouetiella sp.]
MEEAVPKFRWHWQNLTKEDSRGKLPWNGRAWFTFNHNDPSCRNETSLNVEWYLGRTGLRLDFGYQADYENTFKFSFALPGIQLYFTLEGAPAYKFVRYNEILCKHQGCFSFYAHANALWLKLWGDIWSENNKQWWQKTHVFHIDDFFLGKETYTSVEASEKKVVTFPMPEGMYECTMWATQSIRKRPRWFAKIQNWVEVSFENDQKPPRFAGKGENSWDQGDNGIWGTSFATESFFDAANKYVDMVLKYRKRYGNPRELAK